MSDRLIAIGDIHGEIGKLNSLLDKLRLTKSDKVIFLGDYIDRGYNSKAVIERLIKLKKECKCIFLMGNHEDALLNYLENKNSEAKSLWLGLGGATTIDDYKYIHLIPKKHLKFLKSLKPYYKTRDYFFVHGGVRPDKPLEEQEKADLLWINKKLFLVIHLLKNHILMMTK